jgi:hypothetical protein
MKTEKHTPATIVTSIYVGLLYVIFLFLMFGGFAGYISRITLGEGLAPEVGSLDTIIFRGTREAELRQNLAVMREKFSATKEKLREAELSWLESNGELGLQEWRLIELFLPISTGIIANRDILTLKFVEHFSAVYEDPADSPMSQADRLVALLVTTTFVDDAPQDVRKTFADSVAVVLNKLSAQKSEINKLTVSEKKWSQRNLSLNGELKTLSADIEKLESKLDSNANTLKDEHRALIASFKNSLGGIPYFLLQIPTIILTLLVTVATGGLGSVVAFTRKFLRSDTETGTGRLFVNVSEGVAAAFAIFFLAGAGMLMLTQGAAGTKGSVELSPYLVAFIAFISGFMAEDAFYRIQIAGRNLFRFKSDNDDGVVGKSDATEDSIPAGAPL